MNRLLPRLALAAALAAAALAAAAYREARSVRDEVREREARGERATSAGRGRGDAGASTRPASRGGETARPVVPPGDGVQPSSPVDAGIVAGRDLESEAQKPLRALVRRIVAEEMEARKAAAAAAGKDGPGNEAAPKGDEKKPPLSQVAAVLGLSEAQRDAVREAVVRGQGEVIEMLRRPMADGKVPLEEIFDVFLDDPEKAKARAPALFGMLLTEKIPGTDETYGLRWDALKRRTAESFARDLTPEQFREYEKMGLDPLEIQVPGSPWLEVLQDAFQRRRK